MTFSIIQKTAAQEEATAKDFKHNCDAFCKKKDAENEDICIVRVIQIFVVKNNAHFISNPMIFSFF